SRSVTSATTPGTSLRSTAPRRLASSAVLAGGFCAFEVSVNAAVATAIAKRTPTVFGFMEASLLHIARVRPRNSSDARILVRNQFSRQWPDRPVAGKDCDGRCARDLPIAP